MDVPFDDFLKLLELYRLKHVARKSTNAYHDEKDHLDVRRRETTAEHVYSSLRLADYFLSNEREFSSLDRLHAYELLLYHDDVEIVTGDFPIAERALREKKEVLEGAALTRLAKRYPVNLEGKLLSLAREFRDGDAGEARFARAVDKMDALVHELQYPSDWGPKGFVEATVREWFAPAFEYSPTFSAYFARIVGFLDKQGYFDVNGASTPDRHFS